MGSKLEIRSMRTGKTLRLQLTGDLNTYTAPELERCLHYNLNVNVDEKSDENPDEVEKLDIDCRGLNYISSAGLKILFQAAKKVKARGGSIVLRNPNSEICKVFEMTGISRTIEIETSEEDLREWQRRREV